MIAFALPLYQKLIAPLLLLWFIVAAIFIFTQHKRLIKGSINNPLLILYLLSIIWTFVPVVFGFEISDKSSAFKELEIKLSFFFMPLGFYFVGNYLPDKKRVIQLFVSGVIVAFLIDVFRAGIVFILSGESDVFFYSKFSFFMHPGYFSMYLLFAFAALLHYVVEKKEHIFSIKVFDYVAMLIVVSGVFLTTSKTSILALVLLVLGYLIYFAIKYNWKTAVGIFVGFMLLIFGVFSFSTTIQNRFNELITAVQEEPQTGSSSTASRIVIWKIGLQLIKDNPLGYGTGNAVSVLKSEYLKQGHFKAYSRKQNAHNQFIQTTLSLGIIGLFVLIWMFIQPVYNFKQLDNLFLVFLLILFFNFMTEAMLERQAGVIFTAFFYSYFYNYRRKFKS